ncbi:alpha/beta hydrolase [Nocardia sp. NPDC050378]|uniref:alpha/beta fold hydrolase n=1 Tax=Nocardia sp. NPDC050378 TaxID=3155400 RepID=UPI0033FE13F6
MSFEEVDGARIAVWTAGEATAAPLVLVHGNGASHAWWAGMVPLLAVEHHVVVVELSGHGRSDHRDHYSWQVWAAEVAAVIRSLGGSAILAGHSMGGMVACVAAASYPRLVRRLVVFDAYPRRRRTDEQAGPPQPRRYYRRREDLAARFRLRPAQSLPGPELTRLLIDAALTRTPHGWTWRSDPAARVDRTDPVLDRVVSRIECHTTWVFSQHSAHLQAAAPRIAEESSAPYTMVSVPRTHHHLMLEEPAVCAALLIAPNSHRID